jgi:hypothetical protein
VLQFWPPIRASFPASNIPLAEVLRAANGLVAAGLILRYET